MLTRQLDSSADALATVAEEGMGHRHSWLLFQEVLMTSRELCSCPVTSPLLCRCQQTDVWGCEESESLQVAG